MRDNSSAQALTTEGSAAKDKVGGFEMRSGRLFFFGFALTEANASTATMTKVRPNHRLFRSIIITLS